MNLNQLKKYLKGWFNKSPFLNTVVVSSKNDFNNLRNVNYPVCHIEYVSSSTNPNFKNYVFNITIADIQNNKIKSKNVEDIHNNTSLIAQDFIDFHSENIELFELDENIQINPFEEENPDRTAGVTFAVRIPIFREKNICIIPRKGDVE
ncbi:hypothetical protein CHU00_14880 [Sphingobacterium cellulitidis]|uniref:hypothetical protein n=1 Tax=Sphingobacterium cellulitidis TaxID=1768011 RepID=UPI000B93A3DC|nr:hypothetical protein [Sphingobacterium cellulitidis]OYD44896.1 hypothetical protein CHU00_14880 [Sphingobacterium cellulitidis]